MSGLFRTQAGIITEGPEERWVQQQQHSLTDLEEHQLPETHSAMASTHISHSTSAQTNTLVNTLDSCLITPVYSIEPVKVSLCFCTSDSTWLYTISPMLFLP